MLTQTPYFKCCEMKERNLFFGVGAGPGGRGVLGSYLSFFCGEEI